MKAPYFILLPLLSASIQVAMAQQPMVSALRPTPTEHARQIADFQQELNSEYRDSTRSPLPREAQAVFAGLPFYATNYTACVEAQFVADSLGAPFVMQTSTDRRPIYRKYGELHFQLNGKPHQLTVYQSLDLQRRPEYRDYLFVPFTDRTNGHTSYGGGRYIDLRRAQLRGGRVVLDFNRAYNPFCAYSSKYSCPVPPAKNRLSVAIEAGVMSSH